MPFNRSELLVLRHNLCSRQSKGDFHPIDSLFPTKAASVMTPKRQWLRMLPR